MERTTAAALFIVIGFIICLIIWGGLSCKIWNKTRETITLVMITLSFLAGSFYISDDFSQKYNFIILAIFLFTYPFVILKIILASWGERFIYLQIFLAMGLIIVDSLGGNDNYLTLAYIVFVIPPIELLMLIVFSISSLYGKFSHKNIAKKLKAQIGGHCDR